MLETIWFLLWGVLWAIYFMLDGYDLGIGTLVPFLGKTDRDRRVMFNSMGPFWDGNEVWLITAGGVTFAAFPKAYAVMFSGLYIPLMLLLFALIIRGVSLEFRHQVDSPAWRRVWDWGATIGSFLPALILGVAFSNIFMGLPLDENGVFQGSFLLLFNPYGLVGGVLFVLLFAMHGALWLSIKSDGDLQQRAAATARRLWPVLVGVIGVFVVLTVFYTNLLANYLQNPLMLVLLAVPVLALVLLRQQIGREDWWFAWGLSAALIGGLTLFGVVGLYPALLPSSISPEYSITIANAASSTLTLSIMLGVTLVFIPIVAGYQFWLHKTFAHKITDKELNQDGAY
ncbi:MAG: cytochrome d ubiquinol oxidase subunit II [Desulfomicrobium sp.]|jgi:cytochrome bd ubiquinol oxidase subunit II|nr:cytochrome d ubiquinol oxidase subunit II [Pseudomonadota bacterium]MBV1711284.1 cytochrome d ubiquinol oxidase subunit II [Desulfomicrobium sp.]MBU4569955.1 cytochrome d ubiquinol oxidase subunit II [Pseudomonadota bacterium]MBU4595054.1 cytochrome d ubiquinol oxidase subunit II [Pseudomonadota bacterium]MBV1720645.1 cytochrome d ubiquinol oxidase subunit II [Desulfomicrobium sp.]